MPLCDRCGRRGMWKQCLCTHACYCSKACQDGDWARHKPVCVAIRKGAGQSMALLSVGLRLADAYSLFRPQDWADVQETCMMPTPCMSLNMLFGGGDGPAVGTSCSAAIGRLYSENPNRKRFQPSVCRRISFDAWPDALYYTGIMYINESKPLRVVVPPKGNLSLSVCKCRRVSHAVVIDRREQGPDKEVTIRVHSFKTEAVQAVFDSLLMAVRAYNDGCIRSKWRGTANLDLSEWIRERGHEELPEDHLNTWIMLELIRDGVGVPTVPSPVVLSLRDDTRGATRVWEVDAPSTDGSLKVGSSSFRSGEEVLRLRGEAKRFDPYACIGCRAAGERDGCPMLMGR